MELVAGTVVLQRYLVLKWLGTGGMGQVYLGRHHKLGFPVAVKVLDREDDESPARFAREAHLMARVRHPNVVSILDYGTLKNDDQCIVMEFVEGTSLKDRTADQGAMSWRDAADIVVGILAGLEAIHASGVLHRDLKPSNVLLARGDPEVVKLIDFGIAKPVQIEATEITRTDSIPGTPAYMSPEQLLGETMDARSDLYSVGHVLYELLTGNRPFPGKSIESVVRRTRLPPPEPRIPENLPAIPPSLHDIVMSSLDRNPGGRPGTAGDFRRLLRTVLKGQEVDLNAIAQTVSGPRINARRADDARMPTDSDVRKLQADPPGKGLVLAARIPSSVLTSRRERRWLGDLVGQLGRAFTLGSTFWFVVLLPSRDSDALKATATRIIGALKERYRSTARIGWQPIDGDFTLTAASLTGAELLPLEIRTLLEQLSTDSP